MPYSHKNVIITGGCGGIGQYLADKYRGLGANVITFDIVMPTTPYPHHFQVDLGDSAAVEETFKTVVAEFGQIDILINNGAIANFSKPVTELTSDEFRRVIDVNLTGAFVCCREFIKSHNGTTQGRIVNIASTRWHQNEADWEAYGASKGGLVSLTNTLAVSLIDKPITVNAISPGWIQVDDYNSLRDIDHKQHPSGRVGKPKDIVNTCLFLTDDNNDFINGTNIVVDGGMTKKMIYQE